MGEGNQILVEVTKLQTQMQTVSKQLDEIGKLGETLVKVAESTKSAHTRINDFKTDVDTKFREQKELFEKDLAAETKAREECLATEAATRKEDDLAETKAREKMEEKQTWLVRAFGVAAIAWIFDFISNLGG